MMDSMQMSGAGIVLAMKPQLAWTTVNWKYTIMPQARQLGRARMQSTTYALATWGRCAILALLVAASSPVLSQRQLAAGAAASGADPGINKRFYDADASVWA